MKRRRYAEQIPQVTWQDKANSGTLDTVLKDICAREQAPNSEQYRLLETFVQRMKKEILEDLAHVERGKSDPMFDIVHGYPGTGKSRVISWLRELMQEGLGWEHGNQFVCLAFQNAMAALIDGYTIHHWSGMPACATAEGGIGFGDAQKLSTKCQNLRVIIIDELSMVSAELFGALELAVRKVIGSKHTYKLRKDNSVCRFWGINVLMFVDFHQRSSPKDNQRVLM